MLLQMLERHFRFFHAITCEVRGLHSRPNRAPHAKRNVRQFAKARLESVVSGQMDGTRFIRMVASPFFKGEGENLFPQLATATLQSEENYGLQDQQQRETPV